MNLSNQNENQEKHLHSIAPAENSEERGAAPFPVAGIGASAGGLQALKIFLNHLPQNTGIAYVIIQHLSPDYKSILPELLEKETKLPVLQAENNLELKPDTIYVIPPDTTLSITDGHLMLLPRDKKSGIFLPINYFFKQLGYIYQNKAIGILLSGTGSDGTEGFRDIKAEGGITFAQDDAATFKGMPQSAVDAGLADFVLPVENIALEVGSILQHPYAKLSQPELDSKDQTDIKNITRILYQRKQVDFSLYKQSTINRRILRRMALQKKVNLAEYAQLIINDEEETEHLYQDLLINVTYFFRDPGIYHYFKSKILPQLLQELKSEEMIRIWIPACSTGEEAVSYAITIFDYAAEQDLIIPFQVFATDLNPQMIEKARSGIYLPGSLENISKDQRDNYFTKLNGHFQVKKSIRDSCIFATHNLLTDPPFSKMDVVSCQNVLIYFTTPVQKKILKAFHYALKPGRFLFLGKSETIGTSSHLFSQTEKESKIYSKNDDNKGLDYDFSFSSRTLESKEPLKMEAKEKKSREPDIEKEIEKILLLKYVQPSVLIDNDLQIIRFHGKTSPYLQPAFGKASLNLLKMVREDLVLDLKMLLDKVKKDKRPIKKMGVLLSKNGPIESVDLEILPLRISSKNPYFLILFQKTSTSQTNSGPPKDQLPDTSNEKDNQIEMLYRELQDINENSRTISEEYEASREELQSANEEILSSNEELQSMNEELETSKEELQASNEELTTINDELQIRIQEIKDAFHFREAIVETLREPLLILNNDLQVITANRAFYKNYGQKKEDTEGLMINLIGYGQWNIPGLKEHLQKIISQEIKFEDFEVKHEFPKLGELIFLFSATRMSFEDTSKNRILLVIQDITERRNAEDKLQKALQKNTRILNSISDIFISVDVNWQFSYINSKAEEYLNKEKKDLLGKNFWDYFTEYLGTPFHTHLVSAMKTKELFQFEYFDQRMKDWYQFRLFPADKLLTIYGSCISEQKLSREIIQQSKERYETFIGENTEGIFRIELKTPVCVTLPEKRQLEEFYKNAFVAECNDVAANMYGYKNAAEMNGIPMGDFFSKNEKNDASLLKFIECGYRLSDVDIMETRNGEAVYFLINLVGIVEKDQVKRIWGTQRNITDQKNAEIELKRTHEKLDFSLNAGSVGTFTWDLKSNFINTSKILEKIYGFGKSSFDGSFRGWIKFIHPEDLDHVKESIRKSLQKKEELMLQFRIIRPDNSIRWVMTRASSIFDEKGNTIEMSGISIDISETKFREQLIKENEERFRALVQNAFDGITIFKLDGTIVYQSESIEKILGYKVNERLGKNIYKESIVDEQDREKENALIQKCIEHPFVAFQEELKMKAKSGEKRVMEVSAINLLGNSSIRGIIKNYRDVTERRLIEKQKEEFIAVASHELRTPVTSIKAYTQILQEIFSEKNDGFSTGLLEKMDKQIDRLTNLIRDLLDVTKINEGKLELNMQEFDLNEVISQTVEEMQMTTKKHQLIMDIGESTFVLGDKEKISQVLVNLLSNAIKYSPDSNSINISKSFNKEEVTICIQDYGIGISEEIQKSLFSRFFRVIDERTKTFPGLGLGLYISAEIIKRHNGKVWVKSIPGEGSSFCVMIPVIRQVIK